MRSSKSILVIGAIVLLGPIATASAGPTSDEMNAANNPLQPTLGVNLHDYYTAEYYGLDDADANAFLLRGVIPHKLFGRPQIMRATLPIITSPELPGADSDTAVGDLNIFDIFLFKAKKFEWGVGPQITVPSAVLDETGTGKWQAGAAVLLMAPRKWGMLGGLVTWQHSFAGDDDRPTQNSLQVQPFFIRNLPKGWYLRSTALWTWDLEQDTHDLPIGAGAGKVWKGGVTWNVFGEPQWTVSHDGDGVPKFQFFAGLNMQFPLPGRV